jgi:hypothetical protein
MREISLFVHTPFGSDANSQYRCIGPWSDLSTLDREVNGRSGFNFEVAQDDFGHRGIAWNHVRKFDAVYLHRPCQQDQLTILEIAKNLNKPVMIDFDDDLFNVPHWNPHAGVYANAVLQAHIATAVAGADVITVSTEPLLEKFQKVNRHTVLVPNSYSSRLYWYRDKAPPKRNKIFAWRGTNTHDADLLSVGYAWKDLPGKVNFYGGVPWQLATQMDPEKFQVFGAQDVFNYMKQIYDDAPKVFLVPLVDCFFNRCKSNIAYQEALHAGAICVAPDMPEWRKPGVMTYKPGDAQSFLRAATEAFNMPEDAQAQYVAEAYDYMVKLYDSSVLAPVRYKLLESMLQPGFERNRIHPRDQRVTMLAMAALKQPHA